MYENEIIDQWVEETTADYYDNTTDTQDVPDLDGDIVVGLQDNTFSQYWQDRVFEYCYEKSGHAIENMHISKNCAKEYCTALCMYDAKKEFANFDFVKWAHIMHNAINAAISDWQQGIF